MTAYSQIMVDLKRHFVKSLIKKIEQVSNYSFLVRGVCGIELESFIERSGCNDRPDHDTSFEGMELDTKRTENVIVLIH